MEDRTSIDVIAKLPFEILYLILYAIYIRLREFFQIFFPVTPKSLKGEVILVTGGANGIGRGICREIAKQERDLSIIIWDVNEKAISETVTELKSTGVKNVFAAKVDVSDRKQVIAAAQIVRKEIGDVSMLFNNAGISGKFGWEEDPKIFEKVFAVNFFSHSWTLREFLPKMIENGRGHVIAICSAFGFYPTSGGSYGPSKFAVRGLMEGVREDVRKLPGKPNIFFSTVYPGFTATDLAANINLLMTRYKFLNATMTPDYVGANILQGVLRGKEHIYVPGVHRFFRFLFEFMPAEFFREYSDLSGTPQYDKSQS